MSTAGGQTGILYGVTPESLPANNLPPPRGSRKLFAKQGIRL